MKSTKKEDHILVVDDNPIMLDVILRNLSLQGYKVYTSSNVNNAIKILNEMPIDLVITDYKMPDTNGIDLIRHVKENYQDSEIIMITGYASLEGAVKAVKTGAEDYLSKPFTDEELLTAVRGVLDKLHKKRAVNVQLKQPSMAFYGLIGESEAMRKIYSAISKAAMTPATILITGESGTGKELVARATHYNSPRASAQFIPVNCGGIPEGLIESELFGYVEGAFTGAKETRAGFFQTAENGTIFLDEISETSISMQVKLLRVLQDKEVCMVGSNRNKKVDVRIIAATNKNLPDLVEKKLFREDLYFRLNVININIPPLRDRENDIILLTRHFILKFAKEFGKPNFSFSDNALKALKNYNWPGNIRELENLIQRLLVMVEGKIIDVPDLPSLMRFSALKETSINRSLAEMETEHIRNVLTFVGGNITRASKILGIDRKTIYNKLNNMNKYSSS
ncbi:sigma-54-dependent transcriptional regulator [candidate division KSB1 bacterium]